jgi:hypothetical protein
MGVDYGELDLEGFVRFLIDTGNASLESKIPDRKPLQWAIGKLSRFCAAFEALEQSGFISPTHKRAATRSLILGALAATFEIGSHGTESENTVSVIKHRGTAPARAGRSRLKQATDRILSEIVPGLQHPGDEVHAHKAADAILGEVNQKLEVKGLPPVKRDRLARFIKANPARSGSLR